MDSALSGWMDLRRRIFSRQEDAKAMLLCVTAEDVTGWEKSCRTVAIAETTARTLENWSAGHPESAPGAIVDVF